jgi:predicted aconitase
MTSLESTVTIFANSVVGARCNRDGFFAVYAAIAGRYPKFGYHLDETRRGTHLVAVDVDLHCTSDYSRLGFYVGLMVGMACRCSPAFATGRAWTISTRWGRRWRPRAGLPCSSCPG